MGAPGKCPKGFWVKPGFQKASQTALFEHLELPEIFLDIFATSYQQHKLPPSEAEYLQKEITFGSDVFELSSSMLENEGFCSAACSSEAARDISRFFYLLPSISISFLCRKRNILKRKSLLVQ